MTRFHLIRHASYDQLGRTLAGRTPDHPLNDQGRAEAARLAVRLAELPIAAIHSSPVQRARETAAILGGRLAITPVIEPGIEELDCGAWTGQSFAELGPQPAWQAFNGFRAWAPVPGGEAMLTAQARAVATLQRLAADGGEIALVTHSDIIKAILALTLGMPLDLLRRLTIAPASRSILVLSTTDAVIEAVNLPP